MYYVKCYDAKVERPKAVQACLQRSNPWHQIFSSYKKTEYHVPAQEHVGVS